MTIMPQVSIIIPVYNRLHFLGATIESVLAQTMTDWELIVVDDGSIEDVAGFIAHYPDPRIFYVRQENQGNAVARNTGIHRAQGECVICLDSDDLLQTEMLTSCCTKLQAEPDIDVAYTQAQLVDAGGKPLPLPNVTESLSGDLLEPLLFGYPILPSSAVVRRRCFKQWGEYTPGLDDWELWLRWAANGCRFACTQRPSVHYRIHEANFSRDWLRRRHVHFATLDSFYCSDRVPARAQALKTQAYAQQHFEFAVMAWQCGRESDGVADFVHAVQLQAERFFDADSLFRLACAHQGSLYQDTKHDFSLEKAEEALLRPLDILRGSSALTREELAKYDHCYALGCLVLARLAYGFTQNIHRTRHWIIQSVTAWPPVTWESDWIRWAVRGLVNLRRLRELLEHNP
jgi:hypothetical protein